MVPRPKGFLMNQELAVLDRLWLFQRCEFRLCDPKGTYDQAGRPA